MPEAGVRKALSFRTLPLLRLLGSLDPGLYDITVALEPVADTLLLVARPGLVHFSLALVDLIFVEPDGLEEGVGRRIVALESLVDRARDRGRVVERTLGVLRVVEVDDIVLQVHPVRRPPREHDGLLRFCLPLQLGEHTGCARRDQPHVQVVRGDDVFLDHRHEGRPRLDARDLVRPGVVEVGDARYALHIAEYRKAVLGLALVPRLRQELHAGLDLGLVYVNLVVGHPRVLERIEVAAGDALVQRADIEGTLYQHVVAQLVSQDNHRQVIDGYVLIPTDVPEGEGLATG